MHTFHAEQWLPVPVERVFAFFADPMNLPRLMPVWQQARIEEEVLVAPPAVAGCVGGARLAGAGTLLTLSFRPMAGLPFRMRWKAEISSFVWNERFSDLQLRGPFAYWHHVHSVVAEVRKGEGGDAIAGTLLRDDVQYRLPFGLPGKMAQPLVRLQLRYTFAYRHRRTLELLCG